MRQLMNRLDEIKENVDDIIGSELIAMVEATLQDLSDSKFDVSVLEGKLSVQTGELQVKLDVAEDGWHMANGTADLAMKHRDEAEATINALQYQIDMLMLEYCPDEMTADQIENWGNHQIAEKP
jgi:hypothetical protein